jgi:hypothetical protein
MVDEQEGLLGAILQDLSNQYAEEIMFGHRGPTGIANLSFFCHADLGKKRAEVSRSIVSLGGAWRLNKEAQTSFILVNQEFFSRNNMAIYTHYHLHSK